MKKAKIIKIAMLSLTLITGSISVAGGCLMTYASETVSQETVQEIENNSYTDLKDTDKINSEDETKETEETEQTKEIPESDDPGIVPYTAENKTNPKN